MEIDFIKWMATVSGNHDYLNNLGDVLVYSKDEGNNNQLLEFNSNGEMVAGLKSTYRDLLQSAIEGVNKNGGYFIIQDWNEICIESKQFTDQEVFRHSKYESVGKAKESAIRYIYEQEK